MLLRAMLPRTHSLRFLQPIPEAVTGKSRAADRKRSREDGGQGVEGGAAAAEPERGGCGGCVNAAVRSGGSVKARV